MAYEITFALPQDPMPPITDADAYLHGNGHIRGVFEQRGPFYAEFVTEPRENIAAGACYDEWRIMGSPELYRYKYDSATNTVILRSQFPPSQVVFYCMGDRGADNDWSVADLLPEVEANGITLHVSGTIGPQIDGDVYPGWGIPPFDPVDFEATFNINTDLFLPVWSFRANWREPMSERLSFLTDVLTASEGAEQRRSLRPTPRRSFEADFLLTGPERTFWDLFINKLGGGEVTVPLYWETVTLGSALTATVSDRIAFDTTYREWPYLEGRLALLMGKTALDYEVVEIASVDDDGVDLVAPVSRPWPKGTKLLPLRRAVLDQIGDLNHKTAGTATATVQFRVIGPNPWTPAADASPTRDGLPIFLSEPNWVEDLTAEMGRDIALLDTTVGRTYQIDSLGRVRLGQAHRWFLPGRQKLAGFRDLIYRHLGRTGAFWLPTFKADFRLAASAGSAATQITVENVGFFYTGGPTSGREYIAIKHDGGTILRKILSVVPGTTAATEKLNLDAPLGLALSPGQVRRISFADVARFDTDEFEIVHYGGADAHHDVSAMFRTIKNTRTAPTPIHFPIPPGFQSGAPCGYGAGALNIDANSFTTANRDSGGIILESGSTTNTLVITKPRVVDSGGLLTWDAYSLWPADDGGTVTPQPSGKTWNNMFRVYGSNGGGETLLYSGAGLDSSFYTTADAAYAAVAALLPKHFTGYLRYRITCIVDSALGDNRGGLSLLAYITNAP